MVWQQVYDPFGSMVLSTLLAAIPVVVMLAALGFFHIKAHIAAALGLAAAFCVAVFAYSMPAAMAGKAALLGGFTGLLPIGWIVLNIIFLQQLCEQNGSFKVLQASLSGITNDRRLQLLLIAFCFGAFFEGAAGFGTPVAVTAGILIGLGFSPLAASGLSLIANTAPVAFGALGSPVITLAKVHGYDLMEVTAMIGRQLPFFSLLVPFWLIWAFAGRKAMWDIWPAILVTGLSFAIPQFLVSNFIGPELVDIIAALVSMASLILFLRVWQPKTVWTSASLKGREAETARPADSVGKYTRAELVRAWTPWLILTVFVFIWGLPPVKAYFNTLFAPKFPMDGLHNLVMRVPPVVPHAEPEAAVYVFNLLSATGTGILLSAIVGALFMHYSLGAIVRTFVRTLWLVRYSLLTIVLMLALGTLTRYSGTDTTLGLAFANTGALYPFFGTLMGWLGVAMTGSDTASNVLFGGMQKVAAEQLGLAPNLMGAANSSGGVMGKMIDAQSIVVASTATRWINHEGDILRFVFFHSFALAVLVGVMVTLQAYVWPFTLLVIR
ncbi:lactate permease [Massilia sp. Root133]|uniref:L-lactate permease n=1 Tax=Massilia cellulosiltytica TaxID=2683234 RepID=A0A7X3K638_9BURK|nr:MULTISPECIES: L-lactate permease [Telluria group]KQY12938.1 lactate permease [Massilia sp. Root133]KQZ40669.1 lactate permease [Massilia sp. Root1485]MVW58426.1 L-lactate permease [Telluria cellulosilytica]